jgi:hypothetical protein
MTETIRIHSETPAILLLPLKRGFKNSFLYSFKKLFSLVFIITIENLFDEI